MQADLGRALDVDFVIDLRNHSVERAPRSPGRTAVLDTRPPHDTIDAPAAAPGVRGVAPSLEQLRSDGVVVITGYDRVKRAVDVVVAGIALLLCLPALAILVVVIKLASPGPVLYAQERAGLGGRTFRCLKLRTMIPNADAELARVLASDEALRTEYERKAKLSSDPRIYPVGRIIRRLSLDELPQLWNVIKGDMSLVGPRPLALRETQKYGSALWVVLNVRPGLTGIWQVSGRNDMPYDQRVALDANYAKHHSAWGDLSIILRTIPVLLRPGRSGAY